jgi:Mce-associated membrane protein
MNRAKVAEVRDAEAPAEVAEAEVGSFATGPESGSPANESGADSPAAGPGAGDAGAGGESAEAEPLEAADSEPAEGGAEAEAEAEAAKPRPTWLRLPALLLAAAILLTGAGVWFTLEARSAAGNPAADNLALTDVGATADVTSAVTLAMNRIFSYSYDKTDVTEKAAAAVLRGSAKDSYDKLFAQVRQKAPEQKLVLTSRVSAIAVQELRNGHARLLVFLDQSAVRADNNATDSAAAQLSVTAERTGDGWVVTELEPR